MFLVNSRHPRVVPPLLELLSEHVKALLFPKLRRKFAEFLQRSSLKRLSGTHSVTCGGLGYGACYIPCFLGEYRTPKRNPITLEVPWIVVAYIHTMAEKHRNTPRTMCFPIKCGFRLFLRDRLTLHRWTSVETLHYSAIMIFTWFSLLMSAFSLLISPIFLTKYLLRLQNVLLPNKEWDSFFIPTASVIYLRPDTFSVIVSSTSELLRFLQRMAASKPTSWLSWSFNFLYHLVII